MSVVDITKVAKVDPPNALRGIKGWLVWRYEPNENPLGKPRKVPYYVDGGRRYGVQGSTEDRKRLAPFGEARKAAAEQGFEGVGFALLQGHDIVALDFDDCVKDGVVDPQVLALTTPFTYTELSPSGNGVRAFYLGHLYDRKSKGFETFCEKGYVTFTGNSIGTETAVAALPDEVIGYALSVFGKQEERLEPAEYKEEPLGLTEEQIVQCLTALPGDLEYDAWLETGMAVHHETRGEGFDLWDQWSSQSTKYTTREYGWDRWRSFGNNPAAVTARTLVMRANEHGAGISLTKAADLSDFEAVEPEPGEVREDGKPRFHVETWAEFQARPPMRWIIKDVLPQADLAVIYGESGAGKSFVTLDLVAAIARGVEWRGYRVARARRVVYVVAEGKAGFRSRLEAYAKHYGLEPGAIPMGVVSDAPNLMKLDDVKDLAEGLKAFGGTDLIVIDTLAQTTPGANENAGEDMGKALAHCRRLGRLCGGAMVLLVHHSGKDASKGARGWSGIKGALDAELEVVRREHGRYLRVTKEKDSADGGLLGFALEQIALGVNEDGDAITSCVVIEAAVPTAIPPRALGATELVVNQVIQEFALAQNAGIEVAEVVKLSVSRMEPPEGGKRDTRKQRVLRAIAALTEGDDAPYMKHDDGTLEVM